MSFIQQSREIVDNINGNCDLGRLMADEIVFGSSCDTAYDGAILICRAYFEFIDTGDKDAFEKKLESVKEKYNYGDNIDTARKYFDKVFEKKLEWIWAFKHVLQGKAAQKNAQNPEMNIDDEDDVPLDEMADSDSEEVQMEKKRPDSEDDEDDVPLDEMADIDSEEVQMEKKRPDSEDDEDDVPLDEMADIDSEEEQKVAEKVEEPKKAKKAKADKPKCGGKKKNGDACGFNARENGFCKRHSDTEEAVKPRAKKVAAKAVKVQQWGKWENIESDFEEDSDFEYEYEEIWV